MRKTRPPKGSSLAARHSLRQLTALTTALLMLTGYGAACAQTSAETNAQTSAKTSAEPDRVLRYTVAPRDSVIAISERLLENPADWRKVAADNRLKPNGMLRPGQILEISRELLKSQASEALVENVSGGVQANQQAVTVGQKLTEAVLIETDATGVVQLRLADGSLLKIAPSSRLRIERLRRYHRDDVIEARSVLERGRVETQVAPNRSKPIEIRTPFATAAVRGTDFRVSAQPEAATSEVLSGNVSWGKSAPARSVRASAGASAGASARAAAGVAAAAAHTGADSVAVAAGYGAAGTEKGVTPPEPLLPAPDLSAIAATSTNATVRVDFAPVSGARAYRVAVSSDEKFQSVLTDAVNEAAVLQFESRSDGPLFFRVRPVSATRVEGFDKVARIDIKARPFAPRTEAPANNGITFVQRVDARWSAVADASGYRVQLSSEPQFMQILNEQTVNDTSAILTIAPAVMLPSTPRRTVRHWRVAGINARGGYLGAFSAATELRFYATPRPPRVVRDYVGDAGVGWERIDGERYLLQLAQSSDFARPQLFETDSAQQTLNSLPPGRYFVRLAATTSDGVTTPYSDAIELRIKDRVRSSSGQPLESGAGVPVESSNY